MVQFLIGFLKKLKIEKLKTENKKLNVENRERPTGHHTTRPPDHQTSASLCNSLRQTRGPQTSNCRFEVEDQRAKDLVRTPIVPSDTIFGEYTKIQIYT